LNEYDETGVFLGLDVGKSAHHGHGLIPAGKKVFDKQLPNTEPKLRQVFDKLREKFGTVLVESGGTASALYLPSRTNRISRMTVICGLPCMEATSGSCGSRVTRSVSLVRYAW
jgi:hypothetical protein